MILKIDESGRITLNNEVLNYLKAHRGDKLEIYPSWDGLTITIRKANLERSKDHD